MEDCFGGHPSTILPRSHIRLPESHVFRVGTYDAGGARQPLHLDQACIMSLGRILVYQWAASWLFGQAGE